MEELRQSIESLGLRPAGVAGSNAALRRTRMPFTFPRHGCLRLRELARRFDFASAVEGRDEFGSFVGLADWVNRHLHREGRVADIDDPIEILRVSAARGAAFYCSHFAAVYSACAASLGLPARTLGVDSAHEPGEDSTHHGTCEAYSTQWRKWFLIDSMHGMYYLKEDVPLGVHEVDCEWRRNGGRDIQIMGLDGRLLTRSGKHVNADRHESSAYGYYYTPLRVDPFPSAGSAEPERLLYFEDEERRRRPWYQGTARQSYLHVGYRGAFLPTECLEDLYFDVNLVHIQARPVPKRNLLAASFATFTPNLSHFLYQIDGGRWRRFSGCRRWTASEARYLDTSNAGPTDADSLRQHEVPWRLHAGRNLLCVKPVNRFGREGGTARIEVEIV